LEQEVQPPTDEVSSVETPIVNPPHFGRNELNGVVNQVDESEIPDSEALEFDATDQTTAEAVEESDAEVSKSTRVSFLRRISNWLNFIS